MKAKKVTKTALGITMAAALVATSLVIPATTEEAEAATDWSFTAPDTAMDIYEVDGKKVMTTLTQRAASEIPLIFGINVMGGNAFNGLLMIAGTDVNENPDPYIWNYNYELGLNGMSVGTSSLDSSLYTLATGVDGVAYLNIGNNLTNPNGLYQSGGANQTYGVAVEELGGVGYALGWRTDVVFSFSSTFVDQIDTIHAWADAYDEDDPDATPYYREGDEDYYPLLTDVQTAGVSARLYSWTDNGQALSAYLDEHEDLTTRYGDPEVIGQDVAEFSAGIPYYIASLIADGTIEKKTAAYVSSISDNTLTVVDPGTVGSVSADVYAEVCNFDYVESGQYTLDQLMADEDGDGVSDLGVDLIILGASGYSYAGADGNSASTTNRLAVETELYDLGYTADTMPLVMDSSSIAVQIGSNGYNYAPTTPMFMPYVQTYAYMDELAAAAEEGKISESINPVAMVMFMFDECAHVTDESVEDVALYFIGSNWDAVDDELDQVPDLENYVYDKQDIIAAIQVGIEYAQSEEAEKNGNYLLPAYNTSETAYQLLMYYATTEVPEEGHEYITINNVPVGENETEVENRDGSKYYEYDFSGEFVTKYLDLTALVASDDDDSGTSTGSGDQYDNVRTSFEAIVDYYTEGDYGYGDDLQTTLQNYADHIVNHIWVPDTEVEGTYRTALADYSGVEAAISAYEALDGDESMDYSSVEAAIAAVDYNVLAKDQDDVDAMAQAILDAIADLIGGSASLDTAVSYVEVLLSILDESDYTAESWDALMEAYADAQSVLSGKASQETIDDALAALSAAVSALEKASDETAAYSGDTLAIRSGNTFYLYNEIGDDTYTEEFTYGRDGDEILIGDWDGDGVEEICLRRGNVYYIQEELGSDENVTRFTYGRSTDEVLVGDWDNDGVDELAVRRGNIYYYQSELGSDEGVTRTTYGRSEDEILVGDWDGNGSDEFAVRRNGTTYYFQSVLGSDDDTTRVAGLGKDTDTVLVGDWDNNGTDELCIRRGTNILLQDSFTDTTLSNTFRMTQATSNNDLFVIKWQ